MISTSILAQTNADISFHKWCNSMALPVNPSVQLVTTSSSIAGRGIFAINELDEGEIIAKIPSGLVFYPENAEECFPQTAEFIKKSKLKAGLETQSLKINEKKKFRWINKLWKGFAQRAKRTDNYYHMDVDATWQPELTLYALAALREEHPWSEWILQWTRDDPTFDLFTSNVKPHQEEEINIAAKKLNAMMPDLPNMHLRAGLAIRLSRLDEERCALRLNDDSQTSTMYALLGSRAIGLDGLFTGVIPFYDMVNHSLDPNLSMQVNGEWLELFTKREVQKGEELFLSYTKTDETMTQNSAMWALIQWGIPTPRSNYEILDEEHIQM